MNTGEGIKTVLVSPTTTIASGGTAGLTTAEIDTIGYDTLTLVFHAGTMAASSALSAIQVTESDTAGSGHTNVGSVIVNALGADDDNLSYQVVIDLKGRKRYIDCTASTAVAGNAVITAFAVLSNADAIPTVDATVKGISYL